MKDVELKKFVIEELKKQGHSDGLNVDLDKLSDIVVDLTKMQQHRWGDGCCTGMILGGGVLLTTGLLVKGAIKLINKN